MEQEANQISERIVINAHRLTKYYDKTIGIDQISFQVMKGEIFGFLGPNGAGKTTTIRLLLDLLKPTSGAVEIFNKDIKSGSLQIRKRCGYLPGNFQPYANMTVKEFLDFTAKIRNIEPIHQAELSQKFSLERNLSKKIKQLSHGSRQKLGIVQAFAHQPEMVILDEPTIGLDPLMQDTFYELLQEYHNSGNTVFFSSHNLPEVEKICHRVAIIRSGKLVALEEIDVLKKKRLRKLKITLKHSVNDVHLPGATLQKKQGLLYEFLFEGEPDILLSKLVQLPIADFIFPEPDLEEVFMFYYRGENNDQ
jgi:ABC-2 type transport system ATP-binding protein